MGVAFKNAARNFSVCNVVDLVCILTVKVKKKV